MTRKIDTKIFVEQAKLKNQCKDEYNNQLYDYTKTIYTTAKTNVVISCNKHKIDFEVTPNKHLSRGTRVPNVEKKGNRNIVMPCEVIQMSLLEKQN